MSEEIEVKRSDRRDVDLAPGFRKDPNDERFLARLNAALAPHEEAEYQDHVSGPPTLHVLGVPRSGTTLLTQAIGTHLPVGVINNLVAAFWAAPCYGIRLSKKLLCPLRSRFESTYGRTREIEEPHEFGYFWAAMLGYRDQVEPTAAERADVDWVRIRRVLLNMVHAEGRPLAFKSFMLGWYIEEMLNALPQTCFVWIRRDPVQNALSLLRARREYVASEDAWVGLKPKEHVWLRERTICEQVAGQVVFLDAALQREVTRARGRNVLELSYEEFCSRPAQALDRVRELLQANGASMEALAATGVPDRYEAARFERSSTPHYEEVERAVALTQASVAT